MNVREWMTAHPLTTTPGASLTSAFDEMRKKKIRRLPVVDQGKVVGIITQSDLHAALGTNPANRPAGSAGPRLVSEVMTPDPSCIGPDAPLDDAAAQMYKLRISGLPVVDASGLVGIITETDMFRAFVVILGFTESGVVAEFELEKPDHLLAQVRQRTADMIVRNLIVYQDPRNGRMGVRMKLRGRELMPTKRMPKAERPTE